ncbi:MAG TPA: efflux RND transporter periplasmic adaptor subunit [bacterium]|nr:efflux RND transporter periplasmic adaptor subunit [bacterium]
MKKLIVIAVVALIVAGFGWHYYSAKKKAPAEVERDSSAPEIVPAEKGSIRMIVETTGRVVPSQEVEIKCKASGEIINLPLEVSDPVGKGDLIVQLDPQDEERSYKRAEVSLKVSEARLNQARVDLDVSKRNLVTERTRAEAALQSSEAKAREVEAKLKRVEQLVEKKMASAEELDVARTSFEQSQTEVKNAKARIEELATQTVSIKSKEQAVSIAEAQVESDKLSLSDAKKRLSDTTVLSPIDGVVAQKNVQVGTIIASGINNVGGGTTILTLVDLSHLYVLASVDESDIGSIEPGQRARITVDAHPDAFFPGEVVRVATKGAVVSNIVTFEVRIEVFGPRKALLKPEMTASVEITAVEKDDVISVPVAAVSRRRMEQFVTIQKEDGSTEERIVETGVSDGDVMEIVSGLDEGEKVVVAKSSAFSPWQRDMDPARTARMRERMTMGMFGGGGPGGRPSR